jgi:peptidoglycan-associated lipoprotein
MTTLVRAAFIGIGISLLAACSTSAKSQANFAPGRSTARINSGAGINSDRGWNNDRQDMRGAKTGEPKALSVTGVSIEPSLLSACGIPSANAFFEFDSAALDTQDANSLDLVARCLSEGPLKGQRIEVVGNTDPRGTDEYNYQLGKSRAQSVADYLSIHGLNAGMINVISYGESFSTATDEPGWAYERRVDIRLVK